MAISAIKAFAAAAAAAGVLGIGIGVSQASETSVTDAPGPAPTTRAYEGGDVVKAPQTPTTDQRGDVLGRI